jgi:hypothetical protein
MIQFFRYTKLIKYTKYGYCCAEIDDNRSFCQSSWSKKGIIGYDGCFSSGSEKMIIDMKLGRCVWKELLLIYEAQFCCLLINVCQKAEPLHEQL